MLSWVGTTSQGENNVFSRNLPGVELTIIGLPAYSSNLFGYGGVMLRVP